MKVGEVGVGNVLLSFASLYPMGTKVVGKSTYDCYVTMPYYVPVIYNRDTKRWWSADWEALLQVAREQGIDQATLQ